MKLSYAQGPSTRPLIGQTIGDFFDEKVAEFAHSEALVSVFESRRFTYVAFQEEVNRCARGLLALGVQKGERLGIWSTNCVAWVVAQFATAKIGAILVNINPAYRSYEPEFALRQCECNYLVTAERFKDDDYLQSLRELIPELASADSHRQLHTGRFPHLQRIIFLGAQ